MAQVKVVFSHSFVLLATQIPALPLSSCLCLFLSLSFEEDEDESVRVDDFVGRDSLCANDFFDNQKP